LFQFLGCHSILEPLPGVDKKHRNLVAELLAKFVGLVHVDDFEFQRNLCRHLGDDGFHLVAKAAVLARIQSQLGFHLGDAFAGCSWGSSAFSPSPKPMMFFGMPNTPQNHSDNVPRGAGVIVGSSMRPVTLKLATKKEFLIAATLRPSSGM